MPKFDTSFNFGANAAKKPKAAKAKGSKSGKKSDAWRAYVTSKRKR